MIRKQNLVENGTSMVSLLEFWSLFVFVAFHAQFYVVEVGVESLTDQGVLDKPLLALAMREPNILTYAHVVKDHFSVLDESEMSSSDEEDRDWDCFDEDSDEEAEFDG